MFRAEFGGSNTPGFGRSWPGDNTRSRFQENYSVLSFLINLKYWVYVEKSVSKIAFMKAICFSAFE